MATKIILHLQDSAFAQALAKSMAEDPLLGNLPISSCQDEQRLSPAWVYIMDAEALNCPRMKEVISGREPRVVLLVNRGDETSYAAAWRMNIRKVVERTLPADVVRLAVLGEVRRSH